MYEKYCTVEVENGESIAFLKNQHAEHHGCDETMLWWCRGRKRDMRR
jgi:hypothetical protein